MLPQVVWRGLKRYIILFDLTFLYGSCQEVQLVKPLSTNFKFFFNEIKLSICIHVFSALDLDIGACNQIFTSNVWGFFL